MFDKIFFCIYIVFSFFKTAHSAEAGVDVDGQLPSIETRTCFSTLSPLEQAAYYCELSKQNELYIFEYKQRHTPQLTPGRIISIHRCYETNTKSLNYCLKRVGSVTDRSSANTFLEELLEGQEQYFSTREQTIEKTEEFERKYGHKPEVYHLPTDSLDILPCEEDRVAARSNIDRYQHMNHLIRCIVDYIGNELSEKNRALLRCLVTIHSFLCHETEDSGHPDLGMNDLKYLRNTSKKNWKYNGRAGALPMPDWLKPAPKSQVTRKTLTVSVPLLFSSTPQVTDAMLSAAVSSAPVIPTEKIDQIPQSTTDEARTDDKQAGQQECVELTPEAKPAEIDDDQMPSQATTSQTVFPYSPSAQRRRWHPEETSVALFERGAPGLHPKDQELIDTIFSHDRFQTLAWGTIRTCWENLNGKNTAKQSSGGSHVTLFDKNKKVVGGTFAHNDAQTYGYRSIKFIRDALWAIGCLPTN